MSAIVSSTRRTSTRTPTPLSTLSEHEVQTLEQSVLHIISPSASKALNASTYGEHNFSSAVIAKVFNPTPAKNNPTPESAASAASPPDDAGLLSPPAAPALPVATPSALLPTVESDGDTETPRIPLADVVTPSSAASLDTPEAHDGVRAASTPELSQWVVSETFCPSSGGLATGDNLVLERPTLKAQTLRGEVGGDGVMRYRLSVSLRGEEWAVSRRYREWDALRAVVGTVLPEARGLPFPPKHVALPCLSAGRHDPTVVARREAELLVWMKALLELEGARSVTALTGFLCR